MLTPAQHTDLAEAAYYRYPLDVDEANALLAAYRLGHTPAGLHFALAEVTALLVLSG